MTRRRISTTVDADLLARLREWTGQRGSDLLDRALALLLAELDGAEEREALAAAPYEDDPEFAWLAPPGPGLAYDGDIPGEVQRLAWQRRANFEP